MVYIKRSVHSVNMDLIFSIFVALFVVQWQPTYGYSLTNATDSGEFDIFILNLNLHYTCTLILKECLAIA